MEAYFMIYCLLPWWQLSCLMNVCHLAPINGSLASIIPAVLLPWWQLSCLMNVCQTCTESTFLLNSWLISCSQPGIILAFYHDYHLASMATLFLPLSYSFFFQVLLNVCYLATIIEAFLFHSSCLLAHIMKAYLLHSHLPCSQNGRVLASIMTAIAPIMATSLLPSWLA